jgi:predicted DNA-binding mobile mystery protein A
MQPQNSIARQRLDQRLAGLGILIGARPLCGWVNTVRRALGMSTTELGIRMSISQSRASRLERAEVDETIRVSTLHRAAEALNCELIYVLVPKEPLDDMVLRQAHRKATEELALSTSDGPSASETSFDAELMDEWLEVRTLELVDRRGLWSESSPSLRAPRVSG